MSDLTFTAGQTAVCIGSSGLHGSLIEGNQYEVLEYIPEYYDPTSSSGFTWPAYVVVKNENGKRVEYHAHRFLPVNKGNQ